MLIERAKLARLERRKRAGELLDKGEVEAALFAVARQFRDRLLTASVRLGPAVAMQDAATCERAINAEMEQICDELSAGAEAAMSRMAPEAARERE
jgi:hypothetical protein